MYHEWTKMWKKWVHSFILTPSDCADWCLVSAYQVSAQSDYYCRLGIDLKISRGAPALKWLCALTASISLQNSNSVGHVIIELYMIEIEGFERRAPWKAISKSPTEWLRAPMSSIILRSFNSIGHVIREEAEMEKFKRPTKYFSVPVIKTEVSSLPPRYKLVGRTLWIRSRIISQKPKLKKTKR